MPSRRDKEARIGAPDHGSVACLGLPHPAVLAHALALEETPRTCRAGRGGASRPYLTATTATRRSPLCFCLRPADSGAAGRPVILPAVLLSQTPCPHSFIHYFFPVQIVAFFRGERSVSGCSIHVVTVSVIPFFLSFFSLFFLPFLPSYFGVREGGSNADGRGCGGGRLRGRPPAAPLAGVRSGKPTPESAGAPPPAAPGPAAPW